MESDKATSEIVVVTSNSQVVAQLRDTLGSDFNLTAVPDSANEYVMPGHLPRPDAILIVRDMINLKYLSTLNESLTQTPLPVAVFVQDDPNKLAAAAIRHGVTSYVVAGFEPRRVPTLIELTIERFKMQQALQNELLKSQEELAARKVIERAKGLLMDRKQLNEQEAYRTLRDLAMRQSKPIREVAETLLIYSDILP